MLGNKTRFNFSPLYSNILLRFNSKFSSKLDKGPHLCPLGTPKILFFVLVLSFVDRALVHTQYPAKFDHDVCLKGDAFYEFEHCILGSICDRINNGRYKFDKLQNKVLITVITILIVQFVKKTIKTKVKPDVILPWKNFKAEQIL